MNRHTWGPQSLSFHHVEQFRSPSLSQLLDNVGVSEPSLITLLINNLQILRVSLDGAEVFPSPFHILPPQMEWMAQRNVASQQCEL